ncbi:MAG: PEP-CTERM sorting domain-containing protein [Burkholderiales bacterium]
MYTSLRRLEPGRISLQVVEHQIQKDCMVSYLTTGIEMASQIIYAIGGRPVQPKLLFSALAFLASCAFGPANAAIVLSYVSQSSFGFISDGTSNTIQFSENTRAYACFDNVTIPSGITDGTSNTIIMSETVGFRIVPRVVTGRLPITTITDGSSNTITFPETHSGCVGNFPIGELIVPTITDGTSNTIVFEENTRFDVCFNNVRVGATITDGTSNTIVLGENVSRLCYEQVRLADNFAATASVPEPGTLSLLGAGLVFVASRRRRVKRRCEGCYRDRA